MALAGAAEPGDADAEKVARPAAGAEEKGA